MRNQNSKVRTTKRKLSKCEGVCRTYSALQYAYADILEKNDFSRRMSTFKKGSFPHRPTRSVSIGKVYLVERRNRV